MQAKPRVSRRRIRIALACANVTLLAVFFLSAIGWFRMNFGHDPRAITAKTAHIRDEMVGGHLVGVWYWWDLQFPLGGYDVKCYSPPSGTGTFRVPGKQGRRRLSAYRLGRVTMDHGHREIRVSRSAALNAFAIACATCIVGQIFLNRLAKRWQKATSAEPPQSRK